MNGGSQAVRLPAEFRFEGKEVFVRRDDRTGDVVLSQKARTGTLAEYLAQREDVEAPDFMTERSRNAALFKRKIFSNDDE